jgi:chemotaxis protein CheD
MSDVIKVGMADYKTSKEPDILTTLGLGSCVGISIYDWKTKIIGMAHVMLPSSKQAKEVKNRSKFADTAIEDMIEEMLKKGAIRENFIAKVVGGAQMFRTTTTSSDVMKIGQRNTIASKKKLKEMEIKIVSEDTGGNYGRTIEFYSGDGRLLVKTIGHGTMVI